MSVPAALSAARIQLNTLTGARGVLSMSVFTFHAGMEGFFTDTRISQTIITYVAGLGEAAVSFFFMLSGFVLLWATRPGDANRAFWRRRFVKIFPNHAVTWTAGLALMLVFGEVTNFWALLPSLALIHVWIPLQDVVQGTNGPAWSLSVEIFFYALFPLLLLKVKRIRDDRLWRWVFATVGAIVAFTVLVGLLVPSQPQIYGQDMSLYQFFILIFVPPVRLVDFLLGMLIARLVIARRWPGVSWWQVAAAMLAGWVLSLVLPAPLGFVAPMVLANMLIIGKAATSDINQVPSVLTWPSVVWLGDVSFAFYMVHSLVLHYTHLSLGGGTWDTPTAIGLIVFALALSLALGELLRRSVELPAMKRWSRAKRPSAQIATPAPAGIGASID